MDKYGDVISCYRLIRRKNSSNGGKLCLKWRKTLFKMAENSVENGGNLV